MEHDSSFNTHGSSALASKDLFFFLLFVLFISLSLCLWCVHACAPVLLLLLCIYKQCMMNIYACAERYIAGQTQIYIYNTREPSMKGRLYGRRKGEGHEEE